MIHKHNQPAPDWIQAGTVTKRWSVPGGRRTDIQTDIGPEPEVI